MPLKIAFPNLYNVSRKKNNVVSQFYFRDQEGNSNWNLDLRRRLSDVEIAEAGDLSHKLQNVTLNEDEDRRNWKWTADGAFTVRSCYLSLLPPSFFVDFPHKIVWNNNVPTKISFFTWLVHHNSLLTQDNLERKGRTLVNRCCMCKKELEIINHLFLHCSVAHSIWDVFLSGFGVGRPPGDDIKDAFKDRDRTDFTMAGNFIWNILPYVICWNIWKEHNQRMFVTEAKEKDVQKVVLDIKANILYWSHPSKAPHDIRFEMLVFKWEELVRR